VSEIQNIGNRHPADKLYDIREMIAELESEERRLQSWLLANPHDRVGDQHIALIRPQHRHKIDMAALASEVPEVVARHTHMRSVNAVYLTEIARPGKRKARAAA
jgi:hypothetical protein